MSIADASSPERDEAQMIAAILAGDRELYHSLIQPYELTVYRMAIRQRQAFPALARC